MPATKIEDGPEIPATMARQQNITLECVVENYAVWHESYSGTVSWEKDGESIDGSNARIFINQNTNSLTILNLTKTDSGNQSTLNK